MSKRKISSSDLSGKIGTHGAAFVKLIEKLSHRHSPHSVFSDFCELSALVFSNIADKYHYDEREERYLSIIGKYTKDEQAILSEMLGELILAAEDFKTPRDILGEIFHLLNLQNEHNGQFFTPWNVCEMLGKMQISNPDSTIEEHGFIGVSEPCVGSGGMVLGFAKAMLDAGYNPQTQMWAQCTDIDIMCVHMAYIQLTLCGIPAVVVHGNSLTLQTWSEWYTPAFILGGWSQKLTSEKKRNTHRELTKRLAERIREVDSKRMSAKSASRKSRKRFTD